MQAAASDPCSGHHSPGHPPGDPQQAPVSHQCCVVAHVVAVLPSFYHVAASSPHFSLLPSVAPKSGPGVDLTRSSLFLARGNPFHSAPLRV